MLQTKAVYAYRVCIANTACRFALRLFSLSAICFITMIWATTAEPTNQRGCVAILLYHRFGAVADGEMTVTMPVFLEQLRILREDGFQVISLIDLLSRLGNKDTALPAKAVVITSDDGHISVYQEMFPIIRREYLPLTLFVYPSAISNASYAMTWAQLQEMQKTGLVDIESHSYWHPNFKTERRRLSPEAYRRFVQDQLRRSKAVLEQKFGSAVNVLSWPFGIYDADLIQAAKMAGYTAAVTIERRPVTAADNVMALPRYIVTNDDTGGTFRHMLSCSR